MEITVKSLHGGPRGCLGELRPKSVQQSRSMGRFTMTFCALCSVNGSMSRWMVCRWEK